MSYSPTAFVGGNTLQAATMKANDDALRVYLHGGIVTGDLQSSPAWVDTKHVSPPKFNPVRNVQHGVTGHLGGKVYQPDQWYTMTGASFTRRGRSDNNPVWSEIPNTAISFDLRGASTIIMHYHITAYVGCENPGDTTRRVTVAPYYRAAETTNIAPYEAGACPIRQNYGPTGLTGFDSAHGGPAAPYNITGYGQRTGQYVLSSRVPGASGEVHVGLAHWSLTHVALVTSWSVCIEAYY
jgi:hypothetical protein